MTEYISTGYFFQYYIFVSSNGTITDRHKEVIECYPEVPEVLKSLHKNGYTLAVASRTSEVKGAKQLIELFGWDKYFTYQEIFPGCKVTHFKKYVIHFNN